MDDNECNLFISDYKNISEGNMKMVKCSLI